MKKKTNFIFDINMIETTKNAKSFTPRIEIHYLQPQAKLKQQSAVLPTGKRIFSGDL